MLNTSEHYIQTPQIFFQLGRKFTDNRSKLCCTFLFLSAFGDIFVPTVSYTVTFKAAVTRDMPIMCRLSTSTGVSESTIPCSVSLFYVTTDVILSMSISFCYYEKKSCRQTNFASQAWNWQNSVTFLVNHNAFSCSRIQKMLSCCWLSESTHPSTERSEDFGIR